MSDRGTSASDVDVVATSVATTETLDEGVLAEFQKAAPAPLRSKLGPSGSQLDRFDAGTYTDASTSTSASV